MAQASKVLSSPALSDFPIEFTPQQLPSGIRSIEIDNGSNLTLTLEADGAIVRIVAPYVARFALNTGGSWQRLTITATGSPNSTDSIVFTAFDSVVVPPLLPSFGPSAWGAGATPNALANVKPGDQFLAWQIQQLVDALTGVMTGQAFKLSNTLEVTDAITSDKQIVADNETGGYQIIVKRAAAPARQFGLAINGSDGSFILDDATAAVRRLGVLLSGMVYIGSTVASDSGGPGLGLDNEGGGYQLTFQRQAAPAGHFGLFVGADAGELGVDDILHGARRLTLDASGNLTLTKRVSSAATGASGKPLLNYVPLSPTATDELTINGTGDVAKTTANLPTIPASAVAIVLEGIGSLPNASAGASLFAPGGLLTLAQMTQGEPRAYPVLPSTGAQITYSVSGTAGGVWSIVLVPLGYYEAS